MSYRMTDNTESILSQVNVGSNVFLRLFSEVVVAESEPRTPKRTGDLRNNVLKQILGLKGKLKWIKNYSAIQETKQFKNYTTPGTGPFFARNAIDSGVAKTQELARKAGLIR